MSFLLLIVQSILLLNIAEGLLLENKLKINHLLRCTKVLFWWFCGRKS